MKTCSKCKALKKDDEFHFRNKALKVRRSICKPCCNTGGKEHYERYKQYYMDKARKRDAIILANNRTKVLKYLSHHPCVDCGEDDPIVLEFDHIKGEKVKTISAMIRDKHR
jgi:hypothetical protein